MNPLNEASYLKQLYSTEFKDAVHDVSEKRAKSYLLFDCTKIKFSYIVLPLSEEEPTKFRIFTRYYTSKGAASVKELFFTVVKTDDAKSKTGFKLVCPAGKEVHSGKTEFSSPKLLFMFLQNLDTYTEPSKPIASLSRQFKEIIEKSKTEILAKIGNFPLGD
jgi:hypothetical protein